MVFEQRENSGSIFINEDKLADGANPDWPDRKGKAMIGGVMYWVSGWLKKTQDGNTWLSLAFKPQNAPMPQHQAPTGQRAEPEANGLPDDPF